MNSNDKEDSILFFVVVSFVGLLIIGTGSFSYIASRISCLSAYSEYQPQYGLFSGCRIIYNGKLTPTNVIRNINLK